MSEARVGLPHQRLRAEAGATLHVSKGKHQGMQCNAVVHSIQVNGDGSRRSRGLQWVSKVPRMHSCSKVRGEQQAVAGGGARCRMSAE